MPSLPVWEVVEHAFYTVGLLYLIGRLFLSAVHGWALGGRWKLAAVFLGSLALGCLGLTVALWLPESVWTELGQ